MRRRREQDNLAESALRPPAPIQAEGEVRLRVRYCECDPMGVAHHSACIPWFEMGRTELLRAGGVTYAQMESAGIFLVITRLEVKYRAPARYDNMLVLVTKVASGSRVRINHEYELWHDAEDGRGKSALLTTATSTLACVDGSGKVRVLPEWLASSPS
jgi:acyl-CoA thioester hydrolase